MAGHCDPLNSRLHLFLMLKNAIWDTSTWLWICQMPAEGNLKCTISNTDKSLISLPHPTIYTPEQPQMFSDDVLQWILGKKPIKLPPQ